MYQLIRKIELLERTEQGSKIKNSKSLGSWAKEPLLQCRSFRKRQDKKVRFFRGYVTLFSWRQSATVTARMCLQSIFSLSSPGFFDRLLIDPQICRTGTGIKSAGKITLTNPCVYLNIYGVQRLVQQKMSDWGVYEQYGCPKVAAFKIHRLEVCFSRLTGSRFFSFKTTGF